MESEQHPPALSLESVSKRFQWFSANNAIAPDDAAEGGLNLGQMVGALRRNLPVIAGVTTVVAAASLLKAMTSTPTYKSGFEILTSPITVEAQVISSVPQTLSNREQQGATEKGVDQTKLMLLKSPSLLSPIVKDLKAKYPGITYDELAAKLVVTPIPSSEILSVTYQDDNPEKVKMILERVSEAYLRYSLEERLADVRQGIEFVDAQLPELQKRVELIQDRLQAFRQQYNLIDPDAASRQLSEQTSAIARQRLETQVKLNEARALYADLQQQISQQSGESAASPALSGNARYQAILNQLLDVESQIAKEGSLFRDESAQIRVLQDQKSNLLPLLEREGQRVTAGLASQIRELEDRNQILSQAETALNQQVKQLSVVSRQYSDIQQELKIANDNLNQFLAKREALRIDAGQKKTPWQLLRPPADPAPSAANVKRSTILGVILGLLLGVGAALIVDRISNVLHTPEDARNVGKFPILGTIPFNSELSETEKLIVIKDVADLLKQVRQRFGFEQSAEPHYASSPFLEAFRSLYTNISLLSSDTQVRALVISSSIPGEGKSTISIYLAQAAAALGQRVLLVDTDLRLPQIHNRLELANHYGLSNLIALEDLSLDRVVQESMLDVNLHVLTAGPVPPDPTKLLSSKKMQSLMERFRAKYDLVIYDSPPLIGLADTKLIAAHTDGIAMVVGLGKTKQSEFVKALDELKTMPGAVLGLIANGSKVDQSTRYTAYHRYFMPRERSQELIAPLPPVAVQHSED